MPASPSAPSWSQVVLDPGPLAGGAWAAPEDEGSAVRPAASLAGAGGAWMARPGEGSAFGSADVMTLVIAPN